MARRSIRFLGLALSLLLSGCAAVPTVTPVPTNVPLSSITRENYPKVDGSTACIPLATALIQRITGCSSAQAEESIDFHMTDASYGRLSVRSADLLLVYEPAQVTVDALDPFHTLDAREIGLDALVFLVNEDNPVDSLTPDQVRGIYSGSIVNWSQVGGEDREIVAFQRPELSGSQTLMLKLMMGKTKMVSPAKERIAETMADIIDDIAAYDGSANAIGYSVYYYAKNMYTGNGLKMLKIDGKAPSVETIGDRSYGFVAPFYCIIQKTFVDPEARAIRDWLLTDEGQALLGSCGYVPVRKQG